MRSVYYNQVLLGKGGEPGTSLVAKGQGLIGVQKSRNAQHLAISLLYSLPPPLGFNQWLGDRNTQLSLGT